MNITQIRDTLNSIFNEKKKRIIFWNEGGNDEDTIDLKIPAVLTKADSSEPVMILMGLCEFFGCRENTIHLRNQEHGQR
jgi:hypothetical protein